MSTYYELRKARTLQGFSRSEYILGVLVAHELVFGSSSGKKYSQLSQTITIENGRRGSIQLILIGGYHYG